MVTTITVEVGHSLEEWQERYGNNDDAWDFPVEEISDGTITPDEDVVYWLINNRLYETKE